MTADINSETKLPSTKRQTCRKRRGKHVKNEETGVSRRALGYADAGHDNSGSTIRLKMFAERLNDGTPWPKIAGNPLLLLLLCVSF